ncbi:nuclease [Cystobasidiomycetes sp. EMM_F5]
MAEHLTAADLRKPSVNSNDVTPLPAGAADSSASAYARALIAQQEQRQQIPVGDRSNSTFREDVDIPAPFRATLEDYFRSGYDRGHMVPAADAKRSQASSAL